MDDRIRVSDADRDRVTARLRDHFAEGRLAPDELDERISAALNAKTFGDLRLVMADLPGPVPAPPQAARQPRPAVAPWIVRHRGPRLLPLMLFALFAALLIPGGGGWVLFAFFKLILLIWLVTGLAGVVFGWSRRRVQHRWQSGYTQHGRGYGR
jgi:hypothetical protein